MCIRDSVFTVCYSTGGNMRDVMRRTHDIITDKMAIADEIRTKLSANRLELNVITVAPIFLMLMLRTTNDGFAEKFASFGGVVCVTIAVVILSLIHISWGAWATWTACSRARAAAASPGSSMRSRATSARRARATWRPSWRAW